LKTERKIPMKVRWFCIGLALSLLLGMAFLAQNLVGIDRKNRIQDLVNKGNYLVNLIALHPMKDFNGQKSDFFLKTLSECITSEGLVYCFVHDREGQILVSFIPKEIAPKLPPDIETKSLFTAGLTRQVFDIGEGDSPCYEFSKSVFEGGKRTGTIRLGLKPPRAWTLSAEQVSLIGMIALLVFAAVVFAFYGMGLALRPLNRIYEKFGRLDEGEVQALPCPARSGGVFQSVHDLERSFFQIKKILQETELTNLDLTSRIGVTTFRKNQMLKIIDSINFGIITTDLQDQINYANHYLLDLFNLKREEVLDRPIQEVIKYEQIASFISLQESLKSTTTANHIEAQFPEHYPGGVFRVSLSRMRDDEGIVIGKMLTVKNISGEKASEKVKHEFIASVAHEFLTPLTTIKSYNEMLMDGEVSDMEMQKEFFNTISMETDRLSSLIQNLLNISKIEMGSLTINRDLVKTDWLVKDCTSAVEKAAQKKRITIHRNVPDNFPTLMGDKELLKIALINLLGNAVKYCPENARITLSLFLENDMIVFDVMDTGPGISEEDLPRIFDKFYRSKDPHIREQTGSGLGLATTSEIIRLHGGEIEARSEPGRGTQFLVRIPKEDYYLGKA
jgi:PAS domain S-box-containing protein